MGPFDGLHRLFLPSILFISVLINNNVAPQPSQSIIADFEKQLETTVNTFKIKLQKTLEESRIRAKRSNAFTIGFDSTKGFI